MYFMMFVSFIRAYMYTVNKNNKHKIELGVGCLWLCMAPLNVDLQLNHQLFTWAIKHLYYYSAN